MRIKKKQGALVRTIIVLTMAGGIGCQRPDNANPPANIQAINAATPAKIDNVNTSGDAGAATNGNSSEKADVAGRSLASPSDAYHTAYEARKQCDIPTLKRVMSEAMLATLTERAQSDPAKKTLDDMLKVLCQMPQAPNGDIKDEKIVGDEGTVKFQDEKGVWRLMDFQRENGEWKVTMPRGKNELPALK